MKTPILAHDWEIRALDCTVDTVDFRVCKRCGALASEVDDTVTPFAPLGLGTLSWCCYESAGILGRMRALEGVAGLIYGLLDTLPSCAECDEAATRWWSRQLEQPSSTIVSTVTFNPFGRAKQLKRYTQNAFGKVVETVDTCDEHESDGSWASGDLPIAPLVRAAQSRSTWDLPSHSEREEPKT